MNKVAHVEPKVITNAGPKQKAEKIQKSPFLRHLEKVKSTIFHSDGEPPSQLYHYTTASGMLGMLHSGELWATNISYLNDYSEVQYGYEVLREAATELEPDSESPLSFLTELFRDPIDLSKPPEVYVSCFCEQPDVLSQWRGYGDETGYCVGMHVDVGKNALLKPPDDYESMFGKVIYDRTVQLSRAKKALQLLGQPVTSAEKGDDSSEDEEVGLAGALFAILYGAIALEMLTSMVLFFKDPGFREEREWRVVTQRSMLASILNFLNLNGRSPHKFRVSKWGIVPYMTLTPVNGKLPVESLLHGPTAHAHLAEHALKMAARA